MSEDVTPDRTDRTSYRDLLDPTSLALRHKIGLVGLLAIALLPLGVGPLMVLKLTGALYFAVFAMSWDAVSGYTGQISFGHGLFFAVGGYSSALLNLDWGVDPALAIVVGTVLAAVAGIVIGVPALRLEGPYLSLVTLVAPLILLQIFIVFSDTFGGELGLPSPEALLTFESFQTVITANYYLAFGLFAFVLFVLLAVTRSDAGSVFTAIREDEEAVAAAGLNPAKFKIFAFVLSAAVGGLAGAMFVHTPSVGAPQPSQLLVLTVSIEVIIASVLGGMGTIVGPAVGGLFYYMLRDYLGGISWTVPVVAVPVSELDLLLFSLVTLALLFFLPGGVVRWAIRNGRRAMSRQGGDGDADADRAMPDGGTTPVEQTVASYREAMNDASLDARLGSDDYDRDDVTDADDRDSTTDAEDRDNATDAEDRDNATDDDSTTEDDHEH